MINDTMQENNTQKKQNKIPKEISQEILKKMFQDLLKAIGFMIYFIVLNIAYTNMRQERLINDIEVFAGTFLAVGIVFLEKAYKKNDGTIAITGIEFLIVSLHSLSIMHVITLLQYNFQIYMLTSSYIFSIYFVLKAIILYTKGRKEYLKSLSDIPEIVKKEEPVKKQAQKRNLEKEEKPVTTSKKVKKMPKVSSSQKTKKKRGRKND